MKWLGLAMAIMVAVAWSSDAEAKVRRFTVVVANTTSLDPNVAPLEYADDDGARYWELFAAAGDEAILYTVLDADSQRLHRAAAKVAHRPRRADVLDGLITVFDKAQRAVDAGEEVIFTFVLIGHGEVGAGGEGYVALADAPFTRTDLYREVIARSPATTNHIIVDACNSYFMVHSRGGTDTAPAEHVAVAEFVAQLDLSSYPNTGVLLSTSSAKESHEWSAWRAGVFSHQLRSALAGAADANGDGVIEYSEVSAFVSAANLEISDPNARVELFARAPTIDARRPLIDLARAGFTHFLRIPGGKPLRFYLEDARGVRYLDANLSGDRPVVLALVGSEHYWVRSSDGAREQRIVLGKRGRIDLRRDGFVAATIAARGATAEAFRAGLFKVPYGSAFYRGFIGRERAVGVQDQDAPWLPIEASAAAFDDELERLETAAAKNPKMRARLRKAVPAILRALDRGEHDEAMRLLEAAEAGTGP